MGSASESEYKVQALDELIESFDTAMLVTRSLEGGLRARPMIIADHQQKGVLYFATRAEDSKLEEILQEPQVAVTMQTDGRYLSISGQARIRTDQALIDELWAPSWRMWYPEGATDPQLTLLSIEPARAEFWDRSGWHRLEFLWKAGRAILRGEKAPDDSLGGHGKVDLRESS